MLRKHGTLLLAISLVVLVIAACIVRTQPRSQPVYYDQPHEKHKKQKHQKHKH
jgi:hypothetical protein